MKPDINDPIILFFSTLAFGNLAMPKLFCLLECYVLYDCKKKSVLYIMHEWYTFPTVYLKSGHIFFSVVIMHNVII